MIERYVDDKKGKCGNVCTASLPLLSGMVPRHRTMSVNGKVRTFVHAQES